VLSLPDPQHELHSGYDKHGGQKTPDPSIAEVPNPLAAAHQPTGDLNPKLASYLHVNR
jgi:hypothetical protein